MTVCVTMDAVVSLCPGSWLIGKVWEQTYALMPDSFMPGGLLFTLRGRFRDALLGAMLGASGATPSPVYGLLFV